MSCWLKGMRILCQQLITNSCLFFLFLDDDLTPELSDLLSELHGVSSKWRLIGLCLEPKIGSDANGTLNSIMASRPGQPVIEYLSETLDCWLKNGDRKPSWKGIVAALRNPCVNEKRLAQKLEQKYCTIPCK